MVGAAFFLPGGQDLRLYYLPFANGCLSCGFVPYYAQPLLFPLTLIPESIVWPVWILISTGVFLLLSRKTGVNPGVLFLTFPFIGQFWLGQVDVLLCVGLILAYFSRDGLSKGVGIALLMVKPQVAVLLVLYLLVKEEGAQKLKMLAVPTLIFIVSLVVYGVDWPQEWLQTAQENIPQHVWKKSAGFFWPWGLILLPLPFLFKDRKDGAVVSLLVSSLTVPFFSVYSYVVFLILESPWWVLPASYIWMLAYPLIGVEGMKFAWLLPLGLLIRKVSQEFSIKSINFQRLP